MDLIMIFVFLFFAALLIFSAMKIMNSQADTLGQSDELGSTVTTVRDGAATGFNAGFLLIVGILFVAAVISTVTLDVNPAYIWIGFFIGTLVLWTLFNSSDAVDAALPEDQYAQEVSQMPQANSVIRGLPWILLGIFFFMLLGLYAKSRYQQGI